jgi:4-amino-4-deoxy-L-arabinose transferase-like glycosyltransferase
LSRGPSTRWLLASGAAAALAYAFKQNTGVFILAAIVVWCWRSRLSVRQPLAAFGTLTFAWLAPVAVAVGGGQIATLGVLVGAVNESSLASPLDLPNLIPLACLASGVWLIRRDSNPRLRLYLLVGAALFLTEYPRMDTLHLVWSAPLLCVIGAVALDRSRPIVAALSVIAVAGLLAPTAASRVDYLRQPLAKVDGIVAPAPTADALQRVVAEIQQNAPPGEPIFVYPTSPLLYVLADRPNPTRFDHLNPGAANATEIAQLIADLERAHVRLIVISDFWRMVWGPPGANAALEDWLATHFTEIARHGAYRVLAADL